MKKASAALAAIGGITLIAIASMSPAEAGTKRQKADRHWRQAGPEIVVKEGVRGRSGKGQRPYFGADPGRGFGVGPNSYECFGYDCNW